MTRTPVIPPQLQEAPFSLTEARAAGLTLSALKGSAWVRLGDELYAWRGLAPDPWRLLAAWHRISPELTFAGRTAAWMHGLDYEPAKPVEAIAPPDASSRTRDGISIRRRELSRGDVVAIRNLPATSVCRTLRDFCASQTEVEALVAIDMATWLNKTNRVELCRYANSHAGLAGSARLRRLAALAEPAESPMETRLRWLLMGSGLPRPVVQANVRDEHGRLVGRADLYYPAARLVIEFDGRNHQDRLVADTRRQNDLIHTGFTVLRFTSDDLHNRPLTVVAQVRGVLAGGPFSARLPSGDPFGSSQFARVTADGRNGETEAGPYERRPYLRNR